MVLQILLRDHKTFLLKPNPQDKDLPRLLRPSPVVYYDQSRSSIMTEAGRLLRPKSAIIEKQSQILTTLR